MVERKSPADVLQLCFIPGSATSKSGITKNITVKSVWDQDFDTIENIKEVSPPQKILLNLRA